VKRLRTMAELYRENGEPERGSIASEWAKKLKDNCMVPVMAARKGMKTDEEKAEIKKLEEAAIFSAAAFFRELLLNLPFMSSAIQDFLSVTWEECKWEEEEKDEEIDEYTGLPVKKKKKKKSGSGDTRMSELFWGPKARQDEGVRSGKVEDGGLPGILMNLLAAEKSTSSRSPTDYGSAMMSAAVQSGLATSMAQAEKLGIQVNFKPGGGM